METYFVTITDLADEHLNQRLAELGNKLGWELFDYERQDYGDANLSITALLANPDRPTPTSGMISRFLNS